MISLYQDAQIVILGNIVSTICKWAVNTQGDGEQVSRLKRLCLMAYKAIAKTRFFMFCK